LIQGEQLEEVSPYNINYDRYEVYLNQAHSFGF